MGIIGISIGMAYELLKSYLQGRKQKVRISEHDSEYL